MYNFCLFSLAASVFLDETLHKTKAETSGNSGNGEGQSSTDSGIELSRQIQEDDGDETRLIPGGSTSLVVMESDVDSDSDGGVLSFDEGITSDTELLINADRGVMEERGRRLKIRQWTASWSPNAVVKRTRNRASRCWAHCGTCATNCINLTPKQVSLFLVAKLKVLLHKLLEVGRLLKDRKVVLSTSLYGLYGGLQVMANEVYLYDEVLDCQYFIVYASLLL